MALFSRYTAGVDTRNQFTSPPDNRLVQDMADVLEITTGGGEVRGTMSLTSGTNGAVPVSVTSLIVDDGNWNAAYDCWGPPSSWFTKWDGTTFSTIYVDCHWMVSWPTWNAGNTSSWHQVSFNVRSQANPSGASTIHSATGAAWLANRGLGHAMSGTVPGIPVASGQFLEMTATQTSGTLMSNTVSFRWGVSPMRAA